VIKLSSWKASFEATRQELELAERKKQALDELLAKNRLSQPTYEHLASSLKETISDLQAHQRALAQTMTKRANELEKQAEMLKLFLAYLEMQNIAKQLDNETYTQQMQTFTLGLEATEAELSGIKNSLAKIP
jgi:flagellar hook assembly protein FlgD